MTELGKCQEFYNVAKTLSEEGKRSEAKDMYSKCIIACQSLGAPTGSGQVSKLCALSYNNRGHLKYLEVDFDGAVEDYTKALQYDGKLAVAYYNRGLIHYRLGRFSKSVNDQEKALQCNPSLTSAEQCLKQSQIELSVVK